jgi:hypothetical protein
VERVHNKVIAYEQEIGRDEFDPLRFVKNPEWPKP